MANEISLNQLRDLAQRAGLKLSDDALQQLVPGVNRTRQQADELRRLLNNQVEPAGHFCANKGN
ncbi:MAG: hypothetical protein FJ145_16010 [Deltaproteobacteria bacterium]|nr:hypothetical protein [Deltaproteobacteria bacterium]